MPWSLLVLDTAAGLTVQASLLVLFVLLSALFSAAEASLLSLPVFPRRQLEHMGERGGAPQRLLRKPNRVLVTVLLGNYLANVTVAVLAVSLAVNGLGANTPLALVTTVVVATLGLLIVGEFVPRAIATVSPARTARFVTPLLSGLQALLFPVVWLLELLSSATLRLMGGPAQRRVFVDEQELKQMVEMGQAQGIIEEEEQEMISAVLDFGDLATGDIMVPRTDMVAVEDTASVNEIVDTMRETGFSRIPVYHGDLDTVVGVVYGKDLLGEVQKKADVPASKVMKQALFVPETAHLDEVLREMKTRRIHLAVVHDEYGGTAGLLSLEDVLEEIVGDIFDEYDPDAEPVEWINENIALLDARLDIDEVNDALGTELPLTAGYETLGGYLFHRLGRPGRSGEMVEAPGVNFRVEAVQNRRILSVRAALTPAADEEEAPEEAEAEEEPSDDAPTP